MKAHLTRWLAVVSLAALALASCQRSPDQPWQDLADSLKAAPLEQRLSTVNAWWNSHLTYRTDRDRYGVEDYWATPRESLGKGAGDCEDYVEGKYATLLRSGVPADALRWAYVIATIKVEGRWTNQPHMVLLYGPQALVLDSLQPGIVPLAQRADLRLVYSFNDGGVWLPGGARMESRVSKFDDLQTRVKEQS